MLLAGSVGAAVYFNLRQEKAEATYATVLVERGAVVDKLAETGRIEVVASGLSSYSGGTVLFQIGDPSQLIVRGDIAEIDIGRVDVGQAVDIVVDAYPDTTYGGRVRWIAPVGQQNQPTISTW